MENQDERRQLSDYSSMSLGNTSTVLKSWLSSLLMFMAVLFSLVAVGEKAAAKEILSDANLETTVYYSNNPLSTTEVTNIAKWASFSIRTDITIPDNVNVEAGDTLTIMLPKELYWVSRENEAIKASITLGHSLHMVEN